MDREYDTVTQSILFSSGENNIFVFHSIDKLRHKKACMKSCTNLKPDKNTDRYSFSFIFESFTKSFSETSTKIQGAAILQKQATRNWREVFLGHARRSGTFGT